MKRKNIITYIKKYPYLYLIIKRIHTSIFLNKSLGRLLWLKAYHLHTSKEISYDSCLCENSNYTTYLDYGKHKILACTKCGLWRNFPKPETGVFEMDMAEAYDNNPEVSTQLKKIFTGLKNDSCIDMNILDFGCGDGRALLFAKDLGFKNIYGIEISTYLNKKAKVHGPTIFDNIGNVPSNLRFDVILADNVFEHIPNLGEVLATIKKLMKNNGIIIAFVPNIRSKHMHNKNIVDLLWDSHYWQFSPQTFSDLFKKNGFKIIDCKTITENSNKILKISSPDIMGNENGGVFVIAKQNNLPVMIVDEQNNLSAFVTNFVNESKNNYE